MNKDTVTKALKGALERLGVEKYNITLIEPPKTGKPSVLRSRGIVTLQVTFMMANEIIMAVNRAEPGTPVIGVYESPEDVPGFIVEEGLEYGDIPRSDPFVVLAGAVAGEYVTLPRSNQSLPITVFRVR